MTARDLTASSSALSARYRSLFVIGRGGMGAVEAALEVGHIAHGGNSDRESGEFQRIVALKRLLPDAARDSRRVEMFLREARLAAMLDHPNVVRAYDYGDVDGELFLAMEYVEGQALSRVLRALADEKGELGPSLTAHVLAEVCEGLHAAHELHDEEGQALNLVHRDVSPQNVMLGYDGDVRLLDFGVAKIEAESVTKTGEVKGKTAYMSPEQAMGDAIDRRSDLFGVGAVLFECLALRRMWGDGTDMDVIRKLALEKPPRLEDAVPAAPAEMCALYMRLVARDAKDRPASAKEVADELRKLVPQGRKSAGVALEQILEKHFGDQAREQRRRLSASLDAVAPEQAQELRESISPGVGVAPSSRRVVAAVSAVGADGTGANPASTGDGHTTGVGAGTREGRSWVWVGVVAIAVGGVVIWRVAGAGPSTATAPTAATTATSTVGSTSTLPSTSTTTTTTTSTSTSTSTSAPSASAASVSPPAVVRPALVATAKAAVSASARPAVSASAKPLVAPPVVTNKPPPDVDDHPF